MPDALARRLAPTGAILAATAGVATVASWIALVVLDRQMMPTMAMPDAMPGMAMADAASSATPRAGLVFAMWMAMTVAMMLPAIAPRLLSELRRRPRASPLAMFVAGYLTVWLGFALAAAFAQLRLDEAGLTAEGALAGMAAPALLVAIGLYQWTPIKAHYLNRCVVSRAEIDDSPRRSGLLSGMLHGVHCLGCCWALMLLAFVAGMANLAFMAALTAFIVLERVVPNGRLVARIAGVVAVVVGAVWFTQMMNV